jgi:hypothetical protein
MKMLFGLINASNMLLPQFLFFNRCIPLTTDRHRMVKNNDEFPIKGLNGYDCSSRKVDKL